MNPSSPFSLSSPDEKLFVTIPPKGTKAMFDVTVFRGERFWSVSLIRLRKGYRIWLSL
jgi:hypothetical protein